MLKDPAALAPWYNGTGVTAYVSGMMVSAFALAQVAG
jgi:chlorophyll synthase